MGKSTVRKAGPKRAPVEAGSQRDEGQERGASGRHVSGHGDGYFREIVEAVPAAIYMTDAAGRITFYNEAAATLWGRRPELGKSAFCGSWKLYWPDGAPMPHDECPMALALKRKRPIRDMAAIAERPDGSRVPFMPYPTPLYDASGALIGAVNMLVDITERRRTEKRVSASEARYRGIFENARVAVWEEDFSAVVDLLDEIRAEGIGDLRSYFRARPDRLAQAIRRVRVNEVNDFTIELFEAERKETLLGSLADIFLPETEPIFLEELVALWEGRRRFESETAVRTLKGRRLDIIFTMAFDGERCERTLVSILDISARKAAERALLEQTHRLETLNWIAKSISSNLELGHVVQTVTDIATEMSGAKFGAFFYNLIDQEGERYLLYTLSGAPRAAFEKFGLPRNTAVFEPTFRGSGVVRSDDIRTDPRYGRNLPHSGMPEGHLAVVSYLAVPVVSGTGEVHGGLFFGHDQPGVFTSESEDLVTGIAAHAAIAIDNARLLQAAQAEVAQRRRAEAHKELLLNEMKHRMKNSLATVQALAMQTLSSATGAERAAFIARLHAIAGAHELLTSRDWDRARVSEIVRRALEPFQQRRPRRLLLEGPDAVSLDSNRCVLLSIVLHELATNAVKYGALSNGSGQVCVVWELLQGDTLKLNWREGGGPAVKPPEGKGFGLLFIERALDGDSGGVRFEFAPEGVTCSFEMAVAPVDRLSRLDSPRSGGSSAI